MVRLNRALLGIVGLIAIGGTSACGAVSEAKAANHDQVGAASVEVSPNRANPGQTLTVRARCNDNSTTASVSSPAFGTITASSSGTSSALLVAVVNLSPTLQPGTFNVTATCQNGAMATTKLVIVSPAGAQPTVGPHTGGGALAGAVSESNGAAPWLIGSAATLALAGVAGVVSRRRQTPSTRAPSHDGPERPADGDDGDRFASAGHR